MNLIFFVLLVLVGVVAGFTKGTSGFGSSLVAIPLLSRLGFVPVEYVTMLIICNIVLNLLLVNEHRNYFTVDNVKKISPIIIFGIIFTFFGLLLNNHLNERYIEIIAFGLIIIAILVKSNLVKIKVKDNVITQIIVGSFSGLGNGIASIDGPPVVLYLTGIDANKERFKSTLAIHFLLMGIAGIGILYFLGNINLTVLKATLVLGIGLLIGLFIGILFSRRINETQFNRIVLVILTLLATSLLIP